MKRLTMVMRCGDPKAAAEALMYTLIDEAYAFTRMSGTDVAKAIRAGKAEFTNMGVKDGKLVSTNGSLKNYTIVDTAGNLASEPHAVILNRVENEKGDLVGYTIYNSYGVLQEVNVAAAASLARAGQIANGKIRHTQQGDIVSSISGLYPLRSIKMDEAKDKTITADILFIGAAINGRSSVRYGGIIVNAANAAALNKVYEKLHKANAELMTKFKDISGESGESLSMKRTGSAGFYGVYPIDTLFDMVKAADNKVTLPMGKVTIACTDYSDDQKEESSITLNSKLTPTGHTNGTAKSDKALHGYAEKVIERLKGIKIS